MEHLGKNIRYLRSEKDWTQVELAKAAGLTSGTISKLESGDVGFSKESLAKIAAALKVPLEALVSADIEGTKGAVRRVPNLENSKEYVPSPIYVSEASVYVVVMDGAMEPQFAKGDRVLADPSVIYEAGSLVVAKTNKRPTGIVRLFKPRSEDMSDG